MHFFWHHLIVLHAMPQTSRSISRPVVFELSCLYKMSVPCLHRSRRISRASPGRVQRLLVCNPRAKPLPHSSRLPTHCLPRPLRLNRSPRVTPPLRLPLVQRKPSSPMPKPMPLFKTRQSPNLAAPRNRPGRNRNPCRRGPSQRNLMAQNPCAPGVAKRRP